MKRFASCLSAVLLLVLVAPACRPEPLLPTAAPTVVQPQAAVKETWQAQWERLKLAAQKEGSVVMYSSSGSAVTQPLTKFIEDNYKIRLEWVSATTAQLDERIYRERRAGIYEGDIYFSGVSGLLLGEVGQEKVLASLDNMLFLPEVLDKNAWWGGNIIFLDDEHIWAGLLAYPTAPIFLNNNLVKQDEVKSYKDFLDPKWKGKIVLFNPRTGGGLAWAYHVSEVIMGRDYIRALAAQEPLIVNDARQQVEWVAQGKYPVALGGRGENKVEFVRLGAPVRLMTPTEGDYLTTGAGGIGAFEKPPHPNAARFFVNWSLTKEGGTLISKLVGGQSARLDVPTDFLEPGNIRKPDTKYYNTIDRKHMLDKEAFPKIALEVFGSLMK